MTYVIVCAVALIASALTFFSGFGLGTLLLPAFSLFVPVEAAVASTAVVHFLNGLFKLALVGRHVDRRVLLRFGLPALLTALAGAWLLVKMSASAPIAAYSIGPVDAEVMILKIVIGLILLTFAVLELTPWFAKMAFPVSWMPVGGVISGFLGGLSGLQGAMRSAFLVKAGLRKEAFVATGVAIAVLVDIGRLGVYTKIFLSARERLDTGIIVAATAAAFLGAVAGSRLLPKVTMSGIQRIVSAMLVAVALALIAGLL